MLFDLAVMTALHIKVALTVVATGLFFHCISYRGQAGENRLGFAMVKRIHRREEKRP